VSKSANALTKFLKRSSRKLNRYSWPGNIRELDNIISRAVITSEEGNLQIPIPDSPQPKSTDQKTYKEMERLFILQTMEDSGWKVEGRNGAAHKLGLKPSTLRNKMKRLQISRPDF
jgi:transcriptional regulator with GAF, ATPase, and Fis domain